MNRSFWITLTVSAAVCITAVMGQVAKTRSLEQRLSDKRARAAAETERPPEAPGSRDQEPSKAKIDRALAEVLALQPDVIEIAPVLAKATLDTENFIKIDFARIESAYKKIFPDFLRAVQGLSVDELIAVAKAIPDFESENDSVKPRTKTGLQGLAADYYKPRTRMWLLLLAAEQDPLRIYRDEALMAGTSKEEVLEILGREDPAAVLKRLPPMKKETGEPSGGIRMTSLLSDWALAARIRCGIRLLGTDLEQGLEVLSEVHANYFYIPPGISTTLGNTPLPAGAVPGLMDAMGRPEYAAMRDDLIELVLRHTLFESGVAEAAGLTDSMQLTEDELNTVIDTMVGDDVVEAEPLAMLDWMSRVQPDRIPSMVYKWADTDVQAACRWLEQQAPSRLRDEGISSLTTGSDKLDPESAANWAMEIQDDAMRVRALEKIVERWRREDGPARAAMWLEERNLSL